jgi:hypothetical protein
MQTELTINRGGFPPFSARGCQQSLEPLATGELRRTINGDLLYTGKKGHHKYKTTITCQDQAPPALEGIWRGEAVTVCCAQRLWQEISVDKDNAELLVNLERPAVEGSIVALKDGTEQLPVQTIDSKQLAIKAPFKIGDKVYISYRPKLQMRVINFHLVTNEWQQTCGWRLMLEEI